MLTVGYVILINVIIEIHAKFTVCLSHWENHKTIQREENSIMMKKISFQIFTSYLALILYTFDSNFDILSNQVLTFIVSSNFINIIKYIVLPYFFYCCKKRRF